MDGLMLHCGGQPATRQEIGAVPLPRETSTYMPAAHVLLIKKVIELTCDVLPVHLSAEAFGLARDGKQLFAHLRFTNGQANDEMGLCVGVVNSYDKSLPAKFAAGASVFVCDNLTLAGGVTYARKHTRNIWADLEEAILKRIAQAEANFESVIDDAMAMKSQKVTDLCAYRALGQLYGERVLSNHMMTVARNEWEKPSHKDFGPRNQWSLYNAITTALKRTPPEKVMENHLRLHEFFSGIEFDSIAVA